MPLQIVRNDITKMQVDAIVNAANNSLLSGGGVDGAIHKAAGRALLAECRKLGGCETGDAKITGARNLPCKFVIHTVGPVWRGGSFGEHEKLLSCYRKSLALAAEYGCKTVAFPLISSGAYGYPKDGALQTAIEAINGFLLSHDMTVFLVMFDKKAFRISQKLFNDIAEYINDRYAEEHDFPRNIILEQTAFRRAQDMFDEHTCAPLPSPPRPRAEAAAKAMRTLSPSASRVQFDEDSPTISVPPCLEISEKTDSLNDILKRLDESFAEMLFRKIDEKGMTDAQCYKRANIDRRLFSKIRSDRLYKPSKPTAVAFAVALELPLAETSELLMKAGFALSHSYKFDIIIEFFIERRNYNIFEINEALFAFDQPLLGA